jgi:hypothetical protein
MMAASELLLRHPSDVLAPPLETHTPLRYSPPANSLPRLHLMAEMGDER